MKITTIEYIHALLQNKERGTSEAYNAARDLQVRFEELGEPNAKVEEQKIVVEEFMREHLDAIYALKDFESRQW